MSATPDNPVHGMPVEMTDEFVQRVLKVIARALRLPVEKVTIDSSFEDLQADSVAAVEIFFEMETEFDVMIPDDRMESLRTVRQAAEGVRQLIAAKASGATA